MSRFWRGLPFFSLTIFAGLVAIPLEPYGAVETEGATTVRQFWHITLPLLQLVLAIVILFSTIFTLADFNIVFVLTRGGPMNYTHLFGTYSLTVGILNHEIGWGAAGSPVSLPNLVGCGPGAAQTGTACLQLWHLRRCLNMPCRNSTKRTRWGFRLPSATRSLEHPSASCWRTRHAGTVPAPCATATAPSGAHRSQGWSGMEPRYNENRPWRWC